MAIVNFLVTKPTGLWEWVIGTLFEFIPNYGLRILVFTIILKLLLFPLDLYQRKNLRENSKKMQRMQPVLKKLQEQYGHDRMLLQQKTTELYKKEKYSMFSSCLPMLVSMAIFLTLFAGFTNITAYTGMQTYENLHTTYTQYYENKPRADFTPYGVSELQPYLDELKELHGDKVLERATGSDSEKQQILSYIFTATEADLTFTGEVGISVDFDKEIFKKEMVSIARLKLAQDMVLNTFEDSETDYRQPFILLRSIWVSDVPWNSPIQTQKSFEDMLNRNALIGGNAGRGFLAEYRDNEDASKNIILEYDTVMASLTDKYVGQPNGYLVYVVLVSALSFLTQWLSTRGQKTAQPDNPTMAQMNSTMKAMMIMMPFMMAFFALNASAAFTIYMVANSLMTLTLLFISNQILKRWEQHYEKKQQETIVVLRKPAGKK